MKTLRHKHGLVYGVNSSGSHFPGAGANWIVTDCLTKDLPQVLSLIAEELHKLIQDGVTQEEVDLARSTTMKSTPLDLQKIDEVVQWHRSYDLYGGGKWLLDDYMRELETATPEDLLALARKYFKPGTWYLALTGDVPEKIPTVNF